MKAITEDRILQISNNVSEEWVDLQKSDFATKAEFCQVVQYWQRKSDDNWEKFMGLFTELSLLVLESNPVLRPSSSQSAGVPNASEEEG